jgi:hypothetical protein
MSSTRPHKVALVGIDAGSEKDESLRWDCFGWDAPQSSVNLHDYDTWVFYMPSFPTRVQRDTLFYLLSVDYTLDALMSGTRILIVGDPRVIAVFPDRSDQPFLHWTGYEFIWESTGGDTIEVTTIFEQFHLQNYLARIMRWKYALKSATKSGAFQYASIVNSFKAAGQGLRLTTIGLARNRIGELISFALRLQIFIERSDGRSSDELESIVFVPFGDLESLEALSLVMKETLDISIAQEPPKWADEMAVPGQSEVDASISEIKDEIAKRAASLELKIDERKKLRNCLEVLYQIGPPLETAVQSLLKELGGAVEQPKEKGHCDCLLKVIVGDLEYRAALEIKGTNKAQFDMKGFKQVLQWKNEAILEHEEEYRGIFIGNSAIETPPDSREDPFGDGWKKQAKLHKVTVLTTRTLYGAYCANKRGELNITKFWKALFETDGVFELDSSLLDDEHLG